MRSSEATRLGAAGRRAGHSTAAPTSGRRRPSPSTASTRAISTTRSRIDRLPNGNYRLGVHIADVAHYVPEGSALDVEAYERGTSVYFPDRAVHMFPSELVDRPLQPQSARRSAGAVVPDGHRPRAATVVRYELHDGVIHSDARMTYTDVNAILTDQDPEVTARYRDARAAVRDDARAVRDPERAGAAAAARSTSI